MIAGAVFGKFGVIDPLAEAQVSATQVSINWLATLACGALLPGGVLLILLGRKLVESFQINQESGKPSALGILLAAMIVTPAIALCLYVQTALRQVGFGA